ncbi:MAG: hypothetical protein A2017_04155 [Lentisphaerae bacterium GWF2_44_16]|nr:MAG: hypothetical protein A2017_04155 [Lentisphaerae bacterium GWF2_44_16]
MTNEKTNETAAVAENTKAPGAVPPEKAKKQPASQQQDDTNKRKALLVDDSFLIRRLQKELLEKCGFAVTETGNGKEGIDKISELGIEFFSLIVVDLVMPVMNGVEFIIKTRQTFGDQLPPLLVCSSKADVDLIKKLASLGIKGYLVKPIDPAQFTKKLKDLFPDT